MSTGMRKNTVAPVLVIPRDAEAEVVRLALEKVRGDKLVAKAIRDGMSAVEAFRTFGIM